MNGVLVEAVLDDVVLLDRILHGHEDAGDGTEHANDETDSRREQDDLTRPVENVVHTHNGSL